MSGLATHRYICAQSLLLNEVSLIVQIALFFMGIFVYFIFAVFKPYQTRVANLIEALVLIDLLLLTSLFLNTSEQAQAAVRPLSQLLLLLPFISVTIYIIMRIIGLIW